MLAKVATADRCKNSLRTERHSEADMLGFLFRRGGSLSDAAPLDTATTQKRTVSKQQTTENDDDNDDDEDGDNNDFDIALAIQGIPRDPHRGTPRGSRKPHPREDPSAIGWTPTPPSAAQTKGIHALRRPTAAFHKKLDIAMAPTGTPQDPTGRPGDPPATHQGPDRDWRDPHAALSRADQGNTSPTAADRSIPQKARHRHGPHWDPTRSHGAPG
eukprot:gene13874-biopygen12998